MKTGGDFEGQQDFLDWLDANGPLTDPEGMTVYCDGIFGANNAEYYISPASDFINGKTIKFISNTSTFATMNGSMYILSFNQTGKIVFENIRLNTTYISANLYPFRAASSLKLEFNSCLQICESNGTNYSVGGNGVCTINYCTFVLANATVLGSGNFPILADGATGTTIKNSIFITRATGLARAQSNNGTYTNCYIVNVAGSTNNLPDGVTEVDPLTIDTLLANSEDSATVLAKDWSLQGTSPCVGAGVAPYPETDIRGIVRGLPNYDMGAYNYSIACSPGKIRFTYIDDSSDERFFESRIPFFGYSTTISLPWNISKTDNGVYNIQDFGATYDKRECECVLTLSELEQASFLTAIMGNTRARGRGIVVTMYPGSGFFPFGADKGDAGPFTVLIDVIDESTIRSNPRGYYVNRIRMINTGSYPAYTAPEPDAKKGNMTWGALTDFPLPVDWYNLKSSRAVSAGITENSTPKFMNRGSSADSKLTTYNIQRIGTGKIADLINEILTTRTGSREITSTGIRPFGAELGETFSVRIIQKEIVITHNGFNDFSTSLTLQAV
jgi:hypothetical protein